MDRRVKWIENEVVALSNSFQAIQGYIEQWQQNNQRGLSPVIPEASIRSMKLSLTGMHRNLHNIEEILDNPGD